MRRIGQPLAFLAFAVSIYLGLHYYLWVRLIHQTTLSPAVGGALGSLLGSLCAIPLLFAVLPRVIHFPAPEPLEKLGFFWMGSYFLLATAVAVSDLLGWIVRLTAAPAPMAFLGTGDGIAVIGLSLGILAIGLALWGGLRPPPIREVRLSAPDLPAALAGLTIVQLSDVHIGPTLRSKFVTNMVTRVNALSPDLVAITGDLVDSSVEEAGAMLEGLGLLRARFGVVYVPGNHEYYHGGASWFAYLAALGIRVLRNQGVVLGEGAAAFYVAGVDDPTSRRAGGAGADMAAALRDRPPGMAALTLVHQPLHFAEAAAAGVSLQLSGHTHGGQIFPFRLLVGMRYQFISGLYRIGQSHLYVSQGTGFWGPPMRLGASSEITRLSFASP